MYHLQDEGCCFFELHPDGKFVVHSAATKVHEIPLLSNKNAYYVVDPGDSEVSANPSATVSAHVIIATSPDECHWGRGFIKPRHAYAGGVFRYYPVWTLDELLQAGPYIDPMMTSKTIVAKYRKYGGVPRFVFGSVQQADVWQTDAIKALDAKQARGLALGNASALNTMQGDHPKSAVMAFESMHPFYTRRAIVISDVVSEKVWTTYISFLWSQFSDAQISGPIGHAFEAYVRACMLEKWSTPFSRRICVGKRDDRRTIVTSWTPHHCTNIQLSLDILADVRVGQERVAFHPVSEQHPLIDFIYKVGNVFYAVQVTIGSRHDAEIKKIKQLIRDLHLTAAESVVLIYACPLTTSVHLSQTLSLRTERCQGAKWWSSESRTQKTML